MSLLFACSGDGGQLIAQNIEVGYTHAAIAAGLFVGSLGLTALFKGRWIGAAIFFGLVLLHPAWTISAISGDCGFLKAAASRVLTGLGSIGLIVQGAIQLAIASKRPKQVAE